MKKPKDLEDTSSYRLLKGDKERGHAAVLSSMLRDGMPHVSDRQASALGLNPSQAKAYVSALSQELSIIQGSNERVCTHYMVRNVAFCL